MTKPTEEPQVSVPFSVAEIISNVFLPKNPNKMRDAAPEVVEAVKAFRSALNRGSTHAH